MSDLNLADKFPDLRPVERPPALTTINGIGSMLVGRRDYDEETDSYVTTLCFCLLFLPLIALRAYRVADEPGGSYRFLGRVSLSRLARRWNLFMPALAAAGLGLLAWVVFSDTASYKAGRQIAEADRLAERGEASQAARMYRDVMFGGTGKAAEARTKLHALIEAPPESLQEAAGVFEIAVDLHLHMPESFDNPFDRAVQFAGKNEESDPKGALALLEAVAPLDPRPNDRLAVYRRLLERLVAREPDNPALASRLAVLCEAMGDTKRGAAVLGRHEDRLGNLDGAAVLARIRADEGKYDQADKLLSVYLETRWPMHVAAEQAFASAVGVVHRRIYTMVEKGRAPGFDHLKYNSSSQAEKDRIFVDYLNAWLRGDADVQAALKERSAQARVVPAAIELGLVRLYRAQTLSDPAQRRKELERAEQSFLLVRTEAGQTDAYRLRLGQVYYWLGKQAEGKKLFDELLKQAKRSVEVLLLVAGQLREVGDRSAARLLAEEAYRNGNEAEKKSAAYMRSQLFTDLDDKIAWLKKAGPEERPVQAELISARATRARRDGKDEEAAGLLRQALSLYAKMPEDASSLNNSALVHFELFELTQDREQFQRGAEKLDRAIALQPSNSIVIANAAGRMLAGAAGDLIGSAIDLKVLERPAGLDLLSYLYADQLGLDALITRLRSHPGFLKGRTHAERLLLLAPREAGSYRLLERLYSFMRDREGMHGVWQKVQNADIDNEQADRDMQDYYAGRSDEKNRAEWKKSVLRQEAILTAARKSKPATLAVAAVALASTRLSGAALGEPVDADAVVKLSEEADAAAGSSATKSALIGALSFRAHQEMAKQDATYARMSRKTARSLGASLLGYVLAREGPLRAKALANADVKRIVALKREQAKAFPAQPSAEDWVYLRAEHPAEASRIAGKLLADKIDEFRRQIDHRLSPLSGGVALEEYWMLLIASKQTEAGEVLAQAARRGIPMPD